MQTSYDFLGSFNICNLCALTLLVGQQEGHPTCKKLIVGILMVVVVLLEFCVS